jgi:capsular exopolysaccharide synthesis family protein
MDRISKALELAREQRGSSQTRAAAVIQTETETRPVAYTRTRKLAVSPEFARQHRLIFGDDGGVADAYRILRTRVIRRMKQNSWSTLGITSAGPADGKTLTAINLGIAMSRDPNFTVLLVDADLRRPTVHQRFGLEPELGLGEYLNSECTVADMLVNPGIDDFVLVPCRGFVSRSSELLSTPRMARLVEELKSRYPSRLVLFDLPPVLVADDVVAFSSLVDALLLVVEDGKTQSSELQHAVELLEGVNLVGSVLNKSSEAGRSYEQYY